MLKIKPIEVNRDNILQLAERNLMQNNEEAAIRHYLQFLSFKKPHHHKYLAYYNLGNLYIKSGNLEGGLDLLQKSIREKPDFIQSYLLIGNHLSEIQQFSQAYDYYKEAVKLEPNSLPANIGIANVCMFLDKESDALPYFKKCIELDPKNNFLLDRVALAYFLAGELTSALDYQLKALALEESPEGLFNLAEIYKKQNRLDASLDIFLSY